MPCGVCPDKKMVCVNNTCHCPIGSYKIGDWCEEKDSNDFSADLSNTPFSCKESGILTMPSYSKENYINAGFSISFPDGFVVQTSDARYYNFIEYELVQDEYMIVSFDFSEGICGNKFQYANFSAKKYMGSNEVSVFFTALEQDLVTPRDTFTIVFRQ